ncbi:MAG: ATP synthase F1 subunit delta [Planctomycetota bacterium]
MSSEAAQRYASALFELGREKGALEEVGSGLEKARAALAADPSLEKQLFGAKLSADDKKKLIREKLTDGAHDTVTHLLCLLVDRHRESILYETLLAFFEKLEIERGILPVEVETAQPMDDEHRQSFEKKLSDATGRQVIAHVQENPELIGGLRLIVDSRLLDGSVQRELEKMKAFLKSSR